jgi:hypothetical protein
MRIARASHRPNLKYQFRVLNSSVPNAFAVPGGFIVINRGLLVTLGSEAEMAAVLAHETGHVTAKHSLAAYQRAIAGNVLLSGVSIVTGGSMAAQALGNVTANLLQSGFSREQEREADALGVDYMVKAGYSPEGMIRLQEFFWTKLEGGKDPAWIEGIFRTHPFSKERLENTRAKVAKDYPAASKDPRYTLTRRPSGRGTARLRKCRKRTTWRPGDRLLREKKYDEALAKYREAARMQPEQAPFYPPPRRSTWSARSPTPRRRTSEGDLARRGILRAAPPAGGAPVPEEGLPGAIPELEKSMDLKPTKERRRCCRTPTPPWGQGPGEEIRRHGEIAPRGTADVTQKSSSRSGSPGRSPGGATSTASTAARRPAWSRTTRTSPRRRRRPSSTTSRVSTPVLVLSGGEPLLREDLFEIARYGTDKGFRCASPRTGRS